MVKKEDLVLIIRSMEVNSKKVEEQLFNSKTAKHFIDLMSAIRILTKAFIEASEEVEKFKNKLDNLELNNVEVRYKRKA